MLSQQRLPTRAETSVYCISIVSSVFHGSNTYSCFQFVLKVDQPQFFLEQTYQWCFWLLNHSKLQKGIYSLRRSLIGLVFSFWFEEREQVVRIFQLSTKYRCGKMSCGTYIERFLCLKQFGKKLPLHCSSLYFFVVFQW